MTKPTSADTLLLTSGFCMVETKKQRFEYLGIADRRRMIFQCADLGANAD